MSASCAHARSGRGVHFDRRLTGGGEMAEDETAEEERQDSEEQEADEENEETQASAEGSEDADSEQESEEDPADERGESGGKIGEVDIDEVDPDEPTQEDDVAAAQMRKLEKEGPPQKLEDWPTGKAMYLTFGGSEGGEGYEDGSPRQMGPSSLRHHPDGYKGDETVFEESERIGMDKGAKSEGDEGDADDESSGDGSSAEGDDSASAQDEGSGDSGDEESEEAEKAETG